MKDDANGGGKRLRVYEIKAPDADLRHALGQAVAYVAALKFVLTQEGGTVEQWWRLIGFRAKPRRMPSFEAFALVADTTRNRRDVEATIDRLSLSTKAGITPDAMYYHRTPSGRLEIRAR